MIKSHHFTHGFTHGFTHVIRFKSLMKSHDSIDTPKKMGKIDPHEFSHHRFLLFHGCFHVFCMVFRVFCFHVLPWVFPCFNMFFFHVLPCFFPCFTRFFPCFPMICPCFPMFFPWFIPVQPLHLFLPPWGRHPRDEVWRIGCGMIQVKKNV